ncbi:hypothetical protein HZC07_03135 [Candidatus Micrarchaeota archaeon]|nr:hypothetical protein [Candidatus Micrarchaeota archaeon]
MTDQTNLGKKESEGHAQSKILEEDVELKEALEGCRKIIEEKCKDKAYLFVLSKANLRYVTPDDKDSKKVTGNASFVYFGRPALKNNALSKLLVRSLKSAVTLAQKDLE